MFKNFTDIPFPLEHLVALTVWVYSDKVHYLKKATVNLVGF